MTIEDTKKPEESALASVRKTLNTKMASGHTVLEGIDYLHELLGILNTAELPSAIVNPQALKGQIRILNALHDAMHKLNGDVDGEISHTNLAACTQSQNTLIQLRMRAGMANIQLTQKNDPSFDSLIAAFSTAALLADKITGSLLQAPIPEALVEYKANQTGTQVKLGDDVLKLLHASQTASGSLPPH